MTASASSPPSRPALAAEEPRPARGFLRDPERQHEFDRQGYTIVRMLTEEEARSACSELEAELAARRAAPAAPDETMMSYIHPDRAFRLAVDRIVRGRLAGPLAEHVEGYRAAAGAIFFKPPGGGEVPAHRDWSQTVDRSEVTFSVWCALDDVDRRNGALQVVPGSHLLLPSISSLQVAPAFVEHADLLKHRSRSLDLGAGEAVIFDSRTIHWSPPNRADTPRRAAQMVCVPEGVRHVFYALDETSGGARFELIDVSEIGVVDTRPEELAAGARPAPSLGFAENDIRPIGRAELERLLDAELGRVSRGTGASRPLLEVAGLSKKFCPGFRRSLAYGLADIGRELIARPAPERLRRGEFWALDDVSFDLAPGEALAVIGHNGAGKTTLLRTLAGLIKPDRGQVRVRGSVRALLELGVEFDLRLTGRENILIGAAVHGVPANRLARLVESVVDFAELEGFVDVPVQNYSSGMRSRLGYALTAQLKPDLLLVDEVLAVGDHAFQRKCVGHMQSYVGNGGALLLVSHSAHHIQSVCKHAILLDRGRLVFGGSAVEALQLMFELQDRRRRERGEAAPEAGPVAFSEILVDNPEGGTLEVGRPMRVRLRYRSEERLDVWWGFTIWTADQWTCVTGAGPRAETIEAGAGELTCIVPRLPLLPGRYSLRPGMNDAQTTFPLRTGASDAIDLEIVSKPDWEINARRQLGQLVVMDAEWR